jgi:putative phosphoesterase
VVISDTHLRAGGRGLPDAALGVLEGCDAILHAGDVLDAGTLEGLEAMAPTWAVLGNNDRTLVGRLPVTRVVALGGVRIGMVHDSGARAGRGPRLHRMFPDAAVVVFGHSHVPCNEEGVDGQVLFNPGSPTQRRAQPTPTIGELLVGDGRVLARRIIELGPADAISIAGGGRGRPGDVNTVGT